MRYDVNGSWRSIGPKGTVTINRRDVAPLSGDEIDARIKKGEFRGQQFADAVRNLKRLRNTQPARRAVTSYVMDDVVRLG